MEDLVDRIEKSSPEAQAKIAKFLHHTKTPAIKVKEEEKPSYIPFRDCDNCDLGSIEQDESDPTSLVYSCPHRGKREWDGRLGRMVCRGWTVWREHEEEEE